MGEVAYRVPLPRLIGIGFASLWGVLGSLSLPIAWHMPGLALAGVIGVLCAAVAVRSVGRTRAPLFSKSAYRIAVALEVASIMTASYMLGRMGLSAWFLQAVGVAVGLHFMGLAMASGDRRYLLLTVAITLVSCIAIFLPRTAGALHLADAFTGWGIAIVMWGTSTLPSLRDGGPTVGGEPDSSADVTG